MCSVALNCQVVDGYGHCSTVDYTYCWLCCCWLVGFENRPDLVVPASTSWGLLGVTDRDQALLGIATVALFSCLGNIGASAKGGASGLSAVARKNGCLEIIFCIGKPPKIVFFKL